MMGKSTAAFLCISFAISVLSLNVFAQSSRPGLGAIPYSNGVTFRVWAPNASSVTVRGDFNGWGQTALVNEGASGNWSVDVSGATVGQQFRYYVNGNTWKRDPRGRRVSNSGLNGNNYIYDPHAFDWGANTFSTPRRNDTVIYQMHVGTFAGNNPPSTFDQAIARLDHVRNLGINAIKVMPINEFAGDRSWGYNPADLFAVESVYGGPDAFKRFIRACHERGIGVIVDVVHNHYGPSDLSMWRFDGWFQGTYGGIYFYNDNRANTPWGSTRPDFGRSEVRQFIRDQIFMFLEEYRVDGFRWDSVYNIINTDQGANVSGRNMLTDINTEMQQKFPDKLRISEDHAFDFAMNFHSQWDVGYRWGLHGQVTASADSSRNMNTVAGLLNGWPGHHRVVFSEAHDYIARNHSRSRIPSEIDSANPTSIWARKRALLAAGIVMTTPGIPMIFQGQEMNETLAFHDDTALRWTLTNTHAGIVRAYRDLIQSRRNLRDGMQGLKGTGINVHHINNSAKVVGYIRWDQGGQTDDVMVIANFASTIWSNNNYNIQFPSAGTWYRHYNSDSTNYASDFGNFGADQVVASGSPPTANVGMGMYALQIFSKTPPGDPPPPPPPPVDPSVTLEPEEPMDCEPMTVIYDAGDGPLRGAIEVTLHIGKDGWQNVQTIAMVPQGGGFWVATVQVEAVTTVLNMAFHNGSGIWDNNNLLDYHFPISGCEGAAPPVVVTAPVSDITPATARSGGAVVEEGDFAVTERGVVWNTAPLPTLANWKSIAPLSGDDFTNHLSGLTAGRTYYLRAYALHPEAIGYGEQLEFTTLCFTSAPTLFAAATPGSSSFRANWTSIDGAAGYRIDLSTNGVFTDNGDALVYMVDFEGPGETNTSTEVRTVLLKGMPWELQSTIIGTSGNDKKTGARAARIQRSLAIPGALTMLADLTNGLESLRFNHARFGNNTNHPNLLIQTSMDHGESWQTLDQLSPPFPGALTAYSNRVDLPGPVRLRFITDMTGGPTNRINIDDIVMTPRASTLQSILVTGTTHVVGGLEAEHLYHFRVQAIGGATCVSPFSTTQTVQTTRAALVSVTPENPHGCRSITIDYDHNHGALRDAATIHLYAGHNNWTAAQSVPMTRVSGNLWRTTLSIPPGAWQVDFVFHDGGKGEARIWDNNNWNDWRVFVSGCVGQENTGLMINQPESDIIVPYETETVAIGGLALNLTGELNWTNQATGDSGVLPAVTNWIIDEVPLMFGANLIHVSGVNNPVNLNDGAYDAASNSIYTVGGWTSGQNGGEKWGDGWILSATANAGHFLAHSTSSGNLSLGAYGWGLWANSGGVSDAIRPFADILHPGDVLTVHFDNNWIDGGGVAGIGLVNSLNQHLFEFLFIGGTQHYLINDTTNARNTGINWTGAGLILTFELLTPNTYRFTAGGAEINGILAATEENVIRRLRIFNYSSGPGWERNVYVTQLAINGLPVESQEYSAERIIHRRFGPHFLFGAGDEESMWRLNFPQTEIGQVYEVYTNTNLLEDIWSPMGLDHFGNGQPLQLLMTNGLDQLYIRTGIRPVE